MSSLHIGQRIYVDYISSSRTEFSDKYITGSAVIDRVEDGYVYDVEQLRLQQILDSKPQV